VRSSTTAESEDGATQVFEDKRGVAARQNYRRVEKLSPEGALVDEWPKSPSDDQQSES
jgi:hypothetical protein